MTKSDSSTEAGTATRDLVDEGLREAGAISNPVARLRHRSAWLFRLSAVDPEAAALLSTELEAEPVERAQLLLTVISDCLRRGDSDLDPTFQEAIASIASVDPDTGLRVLNSLSEMAIEMADRDRERGRDLLARLIPAVAALSVPDSETQQYQVLASALVGEALLAMDDARGLTLLGEAEELSAALPARDPVVAFLANALVKRDPARAARLVQQLEDPGIRLESTIQVADDISDPELRESLLQVAEADARQIAHWRGPEALVVLAASVAAWDMERARPLFEEALEMGRGNGPQIRCLQWTGVAASMAAVDRDWALRIFEDAIAAAQEENELIKRVTALALVANEMAEPFPRESSELFQRTMASALELEAMWEYAHVMDVVFRADRPPYLDLTPARPLLEKMLEMISDEDPRIPGVMGVPEVARSMAQVDQARAVQLLDRWFAGAERASDSDGMTQAAEAIFNSDPEAGREALRKTHDLLLRRVDCPAMGEFCRRAAPLAADLVLSLAPHIPDRRERMEAQSEAAIQLYASEPGRALELIRARERPVDRSSSLLSLVDNILGTRERPQPQPLLEDLP